MSNGTTSHGAARALLSTGEDLLSDLRLKPDAWALFLDIDGTLIDIAETPEGIVVPPDLPEALERLSRRLGGALALVTGRALPFADELFAPYRFPIAGLHGAQRRSANGYVEDVTPGENFLRLKEALRGQARQWPGVLIEDKGMAVAAHYRQAPEYQAEVEEIMNRAAQEAGPDFTLQRGKMVVELRPAKASKGEALLAFLAEPPFAGRTAIAIGDDVTDEAMFKIANDLGGRSIRVAETDAPTVAQATLPSAAALRDIIAALGADHSNA
jgi:trehalose 6-phosphate phosphatase